MPVFKELAGKNHRVIITRFRNQDDLDTYGEKLGFSKGTLTNLTTEVVLPSGTVKNKKASKKKSKHNESWKDTWK